MKLTGTLLVIWISAIAGIAVAAETPKPAVPDPEYCARRDADPEKCLIQDGPPPRKPIVRKKPVAPQNPPAPEKPARP